MKSYKLTSAFFTQMQRRIVIIGFFFAVIVVPASLFVGTQGNITASSLTVVPIILVLIGFGFFLGVRRQKKLWQSYCIIIDGDVLKRVQENYPEIQINRQEISKVLEQPGQVMVVQATDARNQIVIPASLEDYENVRSILQEWHPIETLAAKAANKFFNSPFLWILVTLASFFIPFISTNTIVVTIFGVFFLVLMGLCIVVVQRDANTSKLIKRLIWLVIFPMLTMAFRVLAAILGIL